MNIDKGAVSILKKHVEEKIAMDQVILPTIPDSLMRIRKALTSPDTPATEIAKVIGADPTLAVKILKVANSAMFQRGNKSIDNLQHAVTRLGNKLLQTLTVNHALVQIFAKSSDGSEQWISIIQNHSINVAAQAYALAKHFGKMNPDDALLAGLLHNIGYLPLLQASDKLPDINNSNDPYWLALRQLYSEIGGQLLEKWNFPETIVAVAREHNNLMRNTSPQADRVDVIIVAQLSVPRVPEPLQFETEAHLIPAFAKLGLFSSSALEEHQEVKMDFVKAYELLAG
jgi:HD-like signal output (HDOD) protein